MRIKYEHEYAVARRTATMSEADSEQESDGDLPILGYIGGMQVDRDELQNDDDGKAACRLISTQYRILFIVVIFCSLGCACKLDVTHGL